MARSRECGEESITSIEREVRAGAEPFEPAARRIVGFTPEGGGFYIGDVFRGIEETCRSRNAQLILVQTGVSWQSAMYAPAAIDRYLRLAADIRKGWLALTAISNPAELAVMSRMRGPKVALSGRAFDEHSTAVTADNAGGVAEAVEHLISHGHRQIGFVGAFFHFDILDRYSAYVAALEKAGIKPDPRLCYAVQNDLEGGGMEAADAIIEAGVPLTAIFASTDTHGVAIMDRLRARGVRVPEDIAIIGFDDSELAQAAVPALTSVRQLPGEIGSTAAHVLIDAIDGHPHEPGCVLVPTTLVRRHSCGCFDSHEHLFDGAVDWNAADWQEQLCDVLVGALMAPTGTLETTDRERIWPSVGVVVKSLDEAILGKRISDISGLDEAWWEASHRTRNAETLLRLVDLLEFVALCRQGSSQTNRDAIRSRLRDFLAQSRLQVVRYAAIADPMRHPNGPRVTRNIVRSFLADRPGKRQGIDWLTYVDAIAGCLGLWETGPDGRMGLRIEALYGQSGSAQGGVLVAPEVFPPADWLAGCYVDGTPCTVMIVPVISDTRDIGVLAAALPPDHRYYEGYWNLQHAAALLAISLENRARATEE